MSNASKALMENTGTPQAVWNIQYLSPPDLGRCTELIELEFPGLDERQFLFQTEHLRANAYALAAHPVAQWPQTRWHTTTPQTFNNFELELATSLLAEAKFAIGS